MARRPRSPRSANGLLMARKINKDRRATELQTWDSGPELDLCVGAGDENRTRTISLGKRTDHAWSGGSGLRVVAIRE